MLFVPEMVARRLSRLHTIIRCIAVWLLTATKVESPVFPGFMFVFVLRGGTPSPHAVPITPLFPVLAIQLFVGIWRFILGKIPHFENSQWLSVKGTVCPTDE